MSDFGKSGYWFESAEKEIGRMQSTVLDHIATTERRGICGRYVVKDV